MANHVKILGSLAVDSGWAALRYDVHGGFNTNTAYVLSTNTDLQSLPNENSESAPGTGSGVQIRGRTVSVFPLCRCQRRLFV